jgi:hypothetical protein
MHSPTDATILYHTSSYTSCLLALNPPVEWLRRRLSLEIGCQ